jgi:hypothetical protein
MANMENPAALATLAGLGDINLRAANDIQDDSQPTPKIQVPSLEAVHAARDLLRDDTHDLAGRTIPYLSAIQAMIAADDKVGLRFVKSKFVAHARDVVKGCNDLIGPDAGGVP